MFNVTEKLFQGFSAKIDVLARIHKYIFTIYL